MRAIDRWVGIAIAVIAIAVYWTARTFPNVPGQKLGASTLPMIVAAGLLACGLLLVLRSARASRYRPGSGTGNAPDTASERSGPALAILGSIGLYLIASEALGFLPTAPACLLIALRAFGVRWRTAIGWAIASTLVVHVAFYKMLKVPLPWGILPPLY